MFKQFWILAKWTSHFHLICSPIRFALWWPKLYPGPFVWAWNVVVNIMWHTCQANLLQITLWLWRFHLAICICPFSLSFILACSLSLCFSRVRHWVSAKSLNFNQTDSAACLAFQIFDGSHDGFPYHFLSLYLYSFEWNGTTWSSKNKQQEQSTINCWANRGKDTLKLKWAKKCQNIRSTWLTMDVNKFQ